MNQSSSGMFTKVFIIVCAVIGVLGIAVFAMSQFGTQVDANLTGNLVVWGTLPEKDINQYFTDYSQTNKTFTVKYVEITENDFFNKFIKSLADDTAPDLILAPETVLVPLRQFLLHYDSTLLSETTYKNAFIRATYKLFGADGVYIIPYAVDPMVMYVNDDILQNAAFQRPPTDWSQIPLFAKNVNDFSRNTETNNIRALAIGSIDNIKESRGLIISLLLQVKNDVLERLVTYNENDKVWVEKFNSVFSSNKEDEESVNGKSAEQVFSFITSFINPNIPDAYSWSRKYPTDIDLFAAGNLGIYFGLASDKSYIDQLEL